MVAIILVKWDNPISFDNFPEGCKRSRKGSIRLLPGYLTEITPEELVSMKNEYFREHGGKHLDDICQITSLGMGAGKAVDYFPKKEMLEKLIEKVGRVEEDLKKVEEEKEEKEKQAKKEKFEEDLEVIFIPEIKPTRKKKKKKKKKK